MDSGTQLMIHMQGTEPEVDTQGRHPAPHRQGQVMKVNATPAGAEMETEDVIATGDHMQERQRRTCGRVACAT